jgi:hypothetical protein
MQVRHDTSLLEKAIEQVLLRASIPTLQAQAEALEKTNKAIAIKRIATGAAVALVAVGLGLGIKFALDRNLTPVRLHTQPEIQPQAQVTAKPTPEPQPHNPPPLQEAAVPKSDLLPPKPEIVTTNFTKFSNRDVDLLGRRWTITAGHHYNNETDKSWQAAWCYTITDVDGVEVKVELAGRRTPGGVPVAPTAKLATMQHAGLDITDALTLASKCPWNDRQYSVAELQVALNSGSPKQLPPQPLPQAPLQPLPQVQPQQDFAMGEDFDIPGGDYRVEKDVSIEVCTSLCKSETQCRAFTYNKVAKWCFLKERVGESQRFANAVSGMKKSAPLGESSLTRWR